MLSFWIWFLSLQTSKTCFFRKSKIVTGCAPKVGKKAQEINLINIKLKLSIK